MKCLMIIVKCCNNVHITVQEIQIWMFCLYLVKWMGDGLPP
uniref:Uncharacterized protein n=1 Tax=Anguilla anguilla TaxID=7936 RepID=A0A0E9Y1L0_ANGAN